MQRKYYMLALLTTLILGTIATYLPPAKSVDPALVRIWIEDPADLDNIYPPFIVSPFLTFDVFVMIESPYSWQDTLDGIVAFTISVRVDPRALEVVGIAPAGDIDGDSITDDLLDLYALFKGLTTAQPPEDKDTTTGEIWGYSNALVVTTPHVGAGGDAYHQDDVSALCKITFKSRSTTIASPIDLIGAGGVIEGIDVSCRITDGNGVSYNIEPEDGYYIAETPDTVFVDMIEPAPTPPNPISSIWPELWPHYSQIWHLTSWEDNTPGDPTPDPPIPNDELDPSDQIDMEQIEPPGPIAWFHVEWVNPAPIPGDGLKDLVVTVKPPPVPEFPLGISLLMLLAPIVPLAYLWRLRRKVTKQ